MSKVIKSFNVYMGEPAKVEAPILNLDDVECETQDDTLDNEIENLTEEEASDYVRSKSEGIIKKAKAEAKRIVDEAMVKIDEEREIILEQAKKNGFEEGYDQAVRSCEDIIQEAGMLKHQALQDAEVFLSNIENEVVSVILDIARKVVGVELSFNPEDILHIVRDAFERCAHKEYVVLKVSENDYEYIVESKNKLLAMVQGVGEIEIKLDHSLEPGSCLLETPYGAIDASANTRLNEIEKVFRGLVGKE